MQRTGMNNLLFLHLSAVFEWSTDEKTIEKQPIKEYNEPVKTNNRWNQYEFYFSKRSK
jgi:hypothetical protein